MLLLLFAIIIRIYNLNHSYDWDEIYSATVSNADYISLISGIRYDPGNPPFYFILLRIWKSVFGDTESRLRLMSIVFFAISYAAIVLQTNKKIDTLSQYILLIFYSGSSVVYYFSRYVRAYMLVTCIAILVFPLLLQIISNKSKQWYIYLIAVLLCAIGLYTHYSFVIFYGMFFVSTILIHRNSRSSLFHLLFFSLLLLILYLPWAYFFVKNQIHPSLWWYKYHFHQLETPWGGPALWLDAFTNQLYGSSVPIKFQNFLAFIIILFINGIIIMTFYKDKLTLWMRHVFLLFLLYFDILLFSPLHKVFVSIQYSIYIIPFGLFALIILIHLYMPRYIKWFLLFISIIFTMTTYKSYAQTIPSDWKTLGAKFNTYSDKGVLLFEPCHLGFGMNYYYHGKLPEYCFYENPEGMYLSIWNKDFVGRLFIIRYSYLPHKPNSPIHQLLNLYGETKEYYGDLEVITLIKKT
ncbi:glycosyltransferase family 39 protein [Candidatus Gottesmanbacteria bacterium]|nr:glycosyltransferase family 39 protein [Candidatus Gottesmanbacteria bacterium]